VPIFHDLALAWSGSQAQTVLTRKTTMAAKPNQVNDAPDKDMRKTRNGWIVLDAAAIVVGAIVNR